MTLEGTVVDAGVIVLDQRGKLPEDAGATAPGDR